MFKVFTLLCLSLVLMTAVGQEYDEMTHDEVISESQLCGESNFFEAQCKEKPNCVYLHWHLESLGAMVRPCMSYNEIMKYYIKNPVEYLGKLGTTNHKTINKSNFCDVIENDKRFMDEHGKILNCVISTQQ